ncbi:MAG: SDR family oxidoreductase [Gemmatimonadales bacterium]|nr:SDR family oxidoreductase [Gemmatimonadales bacterium]
MTAALSGRVAVVTGASRGIGAAISCALSGAGATVVRLARTLVERRETWGMDLACDVTDAAQVARCATTIRETLGPATILVNNAGSFLLAPLAETTRADFDRQYAVNATAPFLVAQAFLPTMVEAGGGRHITIGSVADHVGFPGNAAYVASKYAVRGLHEVLRAEFGPRGIRCTLVSPGPTDTAVWDPIDPDSRPGFTPRRAMLRPEDVAQAVAFVATRPSHVDLDWLRLGPA